MISFTSIVGHIRNYIKRLRYAAANRLTRIQTSWLKEEVVHITRQLIGIVILLSLLGLALVYLIPTGP